MIKACNVTLAIAMEVSFPIGISIRDEQTNFLVRAVINLGEASAANVSFPLPIVMLRITNDVFSRYLVKLRLTVHSPPCNNSSNAVSLELLTLTLENAIGMSIYIPRHLTKTINLHLWLWILNSIPLLRMENDLFRWWKSYSHSQYSKFLSE